MKRNILITGASSGIGKACAYRFAQSGDNLIITGRRYDLLSTIAKDISSQYHVNCIAIQMDVQKVTSVSNAIDSIPIAFHPIDILINNAGLARGLNSIQHGNIDDWDTMIDTNVKGLLYTTKCTLPLMQASKAPHILNIGSIAGREVYAMGNVYCATKFAVDALTRAMRTDLLVDGVKVSQIAPGAVETEFSLVRFEQNAERAKKVYEGFEPLKPEDVADVIHYTCSLPPHVNINDLLLMPMAQASAGNIKRQEP